MKAKLFKEMMTGFNEAKKHRRGQKARVCVSRFSAPIPDNRLDLSDIPEATDAELRCARRVGRPATGNAKQLIAIRIAPKLLS